ncbi:MAG: hypothetical protein COS89_00860 [Deltaproteobacteria bacterium CG07_land_8_20_14_0_80_38_7]|nr:MAG: hypothetical protein COS89_00860 [Deltaproteobacteria bacterium CG07_land_8_20_14_0_80_38_7]
MRKFKILFLIIAVFISLQQISFAGEEEEAIVLDNLRRIRQRQQQEEIVIREQRFVTNNNEGQCTPVQQTRQRIRDIEESSGDAQGDNITINAGHGELDVTDNHGTINSDIDIQIINQGKEQKCL